MEYNFRRGNESYGTDTYWSITVYLSKIIYFQSTDIGDSLFQSSWIGFSPKFLISWILVIQTSQRPVIVNIPGILPTLSLRYYSEVRKIT